MTLALLVIVGLPFAAPVSRAGADSGIGSEGDGGLHLIPEVITNSGISAGGSADFPVKAELFLPEMAQRAQAVKEAESQITQAAKGLTFDTRTNPLFALDHADLRRSLFTDYTPPLRPSATRSTAGQTEGFWIVVMAVATVPLAMLAVFLGRKNARRNKGHARTSH